MISGVEFYDQWTNLKQVNSYKSQVHSEIGVRFTFENSGEKYVL